jgi:hypothetical protein
MEFLPLIALASFAGVLTIGIAAIGLYIKFHYH